MAVAGQLYFMYRKTNSGTPAGQRHSMHNNECQDHVDFLVQHAVTKLRNIIVYIIRHTTVLLSTIYIFGAHKHFGFV
jgi:hypothetical protein